MLIQAVKRRRRKKRLLSGALAPFLCQSFPLQLGFGLNSLKVLQFKVDHHTAGSGGTGVEIEQ